MTTTKTTTIKFGKKRFGKAGRWWYRSYLGDYYVINNNKILMSTMSYYRIK